MISRPWTSIIFIQLQMSNIFLPCAICLESEDQRAVLNAFFKGMEFKGREEKNGMSFCQKVNAL